MVPVDASSSEPSEAEDGQVLWAIWGLVRALEDVETHCNHKAVNVVDGDPYSHGGQRGAGMEGGSRLVRPQLW